MQVPFAVMRVAAGTGNVLGTQVLHATCILKMVHFSGQDITQTEFVAILKDYGYKYDTALGVFRAMLKKNAIGAAVLIPTGKREIVPDVMKQGRRDTMIYHLLSFDNILVALGTPNLRTPYSIPNDKLVNHKVFRDFVLGAVEQGPGNDPDGGSSMSMESRLKLIGRKSRNTIRNRQKRTGTQIRANVVVLSESVIASGYAKEQRKRVVRAEHFVNDDLAWADHNTLRTYNTTYEPDCEPLIANSEYVSIVGEHGIDRSKLAPESGEITQRRRWFPSWSVLKVSSFEESEVGNAFIAQLKKLEGYFDVWVGETVNKRTGEVVGVFRRVFGGLELFHTMQSVLLGCKYYMPASLAF